VTFLGRYCADVRRQFQLTSLYGWLKLDNTFEHIMQSWDIANKATERNDF
jgi:hypothetical protein